jgi:Spherulation-specific family 4/Peptidase inhibitor family I36
MTPVSGKRRTADLPRTWKENAMTHRFASLAGLVLLGALLSGCNSASPQPGATIEAQALPAGTLACFYENVNYGGASFCVAGDATGPVLNTSWIGAPWNDRISSVRLQSGVSLDLYSDINFGGRTLKVSADSPSLPGTLDNLTSSYRVNRPASVSTGMPATGVISYWQPGAYATLPANSVALINPANGIVGASPATIDSYRQIVTSAKSRGVKLLVYVPAGYGLRDPNATNGAGSKGQSLAGIKAQISAYVSAFGAANLYGVFFDEADYAYAVGQTACGLAASEYPALSAYVRSLGLQTSAWNPGWVGSNFCYIEAAQRGDIVVDFERDLAAYQTDAFLAADLSGGQSRANARGVKTWNLIHSAAGSAGLKTALDLLRTRKPDYAYVTDIGGNWQAGDNTWGSPPAYWDAEKACLVNGVCP